MTNDMTTGSPAKHILAFSIPILFGNIFQQLYSMVDTIIVGRFISTDALASVGLTGPLSFLILGFVFGITGGFAVVAAQYFGAKNEKGLRDSLATSTVLSIVITLILTILSIATAKPLLHLMNTPDNIFQDAMIYINIIYIGIGCTMLYNLIACILRALGDSRTPLYFLIISSILNIGLDLLFIITFHMGVAGAAYATIISQGISGILCLIYAMKKYPIMRLRKEDFVITKHGVRKHLNLGLPMAFQFSITAIGTIILQSALNLFGSTKIAAFTAANKVEQLVAQPGNTYGVAIATYVGQNHGADNPKRIKEGVNRTLIITTIFAILASLTVVFFGPALTGLFVKGTQPEVINAAQIYLNCIAIFFPVLNALFVYRNALQGVGQSFVPLMAGVSELFMRSIVAFTLPTFFGFTAICMAGPIAWIGACVPLFFAYQSMIKKMLARKQQQSKPN